MIAVCVVWADAHAGEGAWAELDDNHDEYLNTTVGMLISPDDGGKPGHVTVAQSKTPDDLFDHVIYIPVGMVRSMQTLGDVEAVS